MQRYPFREIHSTSTSKCNGFGHGEFCGRAGVGVVVVSGFFRGGDEPAELSGDGVFVGVPWRLFSQTGDR